MAVNSTDRLGWRRAVQLGLAFALSAGALTTARSEPAVGLLGAGAPVVRLYIPFSAGGGADAVGRNFQRSVSRLSGQAIETVYLTAESGAAAGRAVHAAPPDGRTLLLARVGSSAIQPALSPRTATPLSDFTVLALLDQAPLICVVRAASPIHSMRELQDAIAAQPGRLRYSTAGAGTLQNLAVRYLLSLSGLPDGAARPVHFDQGPRATQAVLDGEADFSCNSARSVLAPLQAGTLRGLMTTAQGRLKALPRLQNAAELGLRDMQNLQGWSALVGPPGMSPAIVSQWRALLDQVAADPQWQSATEAGGAAPRIHALRDPATYLRQQQQFYERLVTLLVAQR